MTDPNPQQSLRRVFRVAFFPLVCLCLAALSSLWAAEPATGTIQGRVVNGENGNYLSKAVVTLAGSSQAAFTDDFGNYTLLDVPAGTAILKVEYTGQTPLTTTVKIAAGQTVNQDFMFNRAKAAATSGEGQVVKLDKFVVTSERFKNAQEVAVNEERYSTTLKNVVASDAFGYVTKGNVGEFVKFLPGVQVQYGGDYINPADASYISVLGYGVENKAIMFDGMPVSNPSPASLSRAVGLDMMSINNASRVELIKVQTPDMPSNSAGGAINLITKSAFEYALPQLTVDLHASVNSKDTTIFKKQQGPANKKTYHTLPSGSFSYIKPFSKKLGMSITVSSENNYTPTERAQPSWTNTALSYDLTSVGGVKGNLTNSAGYTSDLAHPFLSKIAVTDQPWNTFTRSVSARVDWSPNPHHVFQFTGGYSDYDGINVSRKLTYTLTTPSDWGSDFVTGISYPTGSKLSNPKETVNMQVIARDKTGFSTNAGIKYSYNQGPWRISAQASWSMGYGTYKDTQNKHFSEVDMIINAGQISFAGIKDGMPSTITVTSRAGAVIDPTQLSNYALDSFYAQSGVTRSRDTERTYLLSVERDFLFSKFSLTPKIGAERDESKQSKWGKGTGYKMAYVGPTLSYSDVLDTTYNKSPGFGWKTQQWADTYKIYSVYEQHPEYFDPNDSGVIVGNYNSWVNQQKSILEVKTSYYAMITGRFFNNRLTVVTGARQQRTKNDGRGPYTDSKWNYLKNPDGTLYVDSVLGTTIRLDSATSALFTDSSLRSRLTAAGVWYPDHVINATLTPLEQRKLNLIANRPIHSKKVDPIAPMLAASYNITPNLVFKPSWKRATTLPSYENSAAGILSGNGAFSINENDPHTTVLGGDGTIKVANPDLRPKKTDSYQAALSYYTKNGGSITVSYFYDKTKGEWLTTNVYYYDSEYSSILSGLGLNPSDYENWVIATTVNSQETSSNKGYEISVAQNLGILGSFGQHFYVFGNYSRKLMHQSSNSNVIAISQSANETVAGGVRIGFKRFSASVRGTVQNSSWNRNSDVTYPATGLKYSVYDVTPKLIKLDVGADYQISSRWNLYVSANNVLNTKTVTKRYDAYGIVPDYAKYVSDYRYGVIVTAGVTARF